MEGPEQYLSVEELVRSFVDIVSKNGNLLLNVGPMADGTIPPMQRERLLGLGAWLALNGEAIFGSRPWLTAEGKSSDGVGVRYTTKAGTVYATLLGTPSTDSVTIEGLAAGADTVVHLLGRSEPLVWQETATGLRIELTGLVDAPAHTLRLRGTVYPK